MRKPGSRKKEPPTGPGGRALERLRQAEQQRGLEPERPAATKPRKKKSPAK